MHFIRGVSPSTGPGWLPGEGGGTARVWGGRWKASSTPGNQQENKG